MSTEIQSTPASESSQRLKDEWVGAVDSQFKLVELWSKAHGWKTRRRPTRIDEPGLGTYQVWKLTVETDKGMIHFHPVARRVTSASGLIDLMAYHRADPTRMLVRHDDGHWTIHPFGDSDIGRPWTESDFIETAVEMINESA